MNRSLLLKSLIGIVIITVASCMVYVGYSYSLQSQSTTLTPSVTNVATTGQTQSANVSQLCKQEEKNLPVSCLSDYVGPDICVTSLSDEYEKCSYEVAKSESELGDDYQSVTVERVYRKDGLILIDTKPYLTSTGGVGPIDCVYKKDLPFAAKDLNGKVIPDVEYVCGQDGYYSLQGTSRTSIYELSPDVQIRRRLDNSYLNLSAISPDQLLTQDKFAPFTLIFKNGKILFMHENWVQ